MLTRDYLALIKHRQLCLEEDQPVVPPNKIDDQRSAWITKYKLMRNPLTPREPLNYSKSLSTEDDAELASLDDDSRVNFINDENDSNKITNGGETPFI